MPLTPEQKQILKLLLVNRNPQSYLAGGSAINRNENSPRFSTDLDIFHETQIEVAEAAKKDSETLKTARYQVKWVLEQPLSLIPDHQK
jgi:predicted nucleotidyltransferase component of viral defense system